MDEAQVFEEIYLRLIRRLIQPQVTDFRTATEWQLFAGAETRSREHYSWHGLKRSADPQHPYLVFQFTLRGRGAFDFEGKTVALRPGDAFAAVVPSDHCYYLPRNSASWSFFWLTAYHTYIVRRLAPLVAAAGPVFHIPPDTKLLARSLTLWDEQQNPTGGDALAREQSLFEWMFEFERFCHSVLYPQAERDRWLNDVRHRVMDNLSRSHGVEELAEAQGLSRSHFSHRFKAATGISPAAWIQQIRLEEAARRLAHTDDKLEMIAREVGLGDANHLCKVFRRRFHLSPGEFRRQTKR
jgi:AraC-like DNA-binding protein